MRTNRYAGVLAALTVAVTVLGSACAPTPRAKSIAVTYYYMPG